MLSFLSSIGEEKSAQTPIFRTFNFLSKIELYRRRVPFVGVYIRPGSNPADALSRKRKLGLPEHARTLVL